MKTDQRRFLRTCFLQWRLELVPLIFNPACPATSGRNQQDLDQDRQEILHSILMQGRSFATEFLREIFGGALWFTV